MGARIGAGCFLAALFVFLSCSGTSETSTALVTVAPTNATVRRSGTVQFTVTVTGTANQAVTWFVGGGSTSGTITDAGVYSAPDVLGAFHVIARSQADSRGVGTAAVLVSSIIMTSRRARQGACLLPNGKVLLSGGDLTDSSTPSATSELFDPVAGSFAASGSMAVARSGHTQTLLGNGQVLVTGGSGRVASAELYDSSTGLFAPTGDMGQKRYSHTATLLQNGQVLITGGDTAEVYDSDRGLFSPTGNPATSFYGQTATLLTDGRVLVVGGDYGAAEIYDPSSGIFTRAGSLGSERVGHTATLLPNGMVLITGGASSDEGDYLISVRSTELFDPASGTFRSAGDMNFKRAYHTAVLLQNGKMLIAGGISEGYGFATFTAELYDPNAGTFVPTGDLGIRRSEHTATVLPDGMVLEAGGANFFSAVPSAEVYDPASGRFR